MAALTHPRGRDVAIRGKGDRYRRCERIRSR